ncbi:MAG: GNAT family N-acetyltransferase [Bacteroidota bacterium]
MAEFLGERTVFPFYKEIRYKRRLLLDEPLPSQDTLKNTTFIIEDFPDYLETKQPNVEGIRLKRIQLYKGFLIDFSHYTGLEIYLKNHFGKSSRSKLRRYLRRLDHCLEPRFEMYFGHIDKEEYDFLFKEFKKMLNRRFTQKKERNYELQYWEEFEELTYPLIMDKKASLFVIYVGKKPINICMNMVFDKILFSNVSCYDIDYSAFNLGTIDMFKHIEWCFENNMEAMDVLKGYYYYKKRWINTIYNYEYHFIYDSKNLLTRLRVFQKSFRTNFYFKTLGKLKKIKLDVVYRKIKTLAYLSSQNRKNNTISFTTEELAKEEWSNLSELLRVDSNEYQVHNLLEPINDFLYTKHERLNEIQVFRDDKKPNTYLVFGKSNFLKIQFQP